MPCHSPASFLKSNTFTIVSPGKRKVKLSSATCQPSCAHHWFWNLHKDEHPWSVSPGPCLITRVTEHSSLSCKVTTTHPCLSRNTSRKLQGNHIWKSSCQLEITLQPEMSINRTARVWSSLGTIRGGKESQRTSLKPWLSAVMGAQVMVKANFIF